MKISYQRLKVSSPHSYAVWMKTIANALVLESSDCAAFRLHVLDVYYHHGWKTVVSAFKISKSTLYNWRKAYEKAQKKTYALIPRSTRPNQVRSMHTDPRVVAFIASIREEYGISKYKVKPFLDQYTQELGIPSLSTTTIGKIIKRKRLFFFKKKSLSKKRRLFVMRLKKAPREKVPGYLEMDSITLWVLNKRWCFMSVIDVVTKYAYCSVVSGLTAQRAQDVLSAFQRYYQIPLRVVQTDNGSEFLGVFHQQLEEQGIIHHFIYPRSPRINGVVERFNRTVQEECINRCDELFYDQEVFKQKLTHYLIWYNTKRPHHSLKLMSPTEYLKQLASFPICG